MYSQSRKWNHGSQSVARLCDGPWSPHQIRNPTLSVSPNVIEYTQEDFSQYHEGPRSDSDNVSDSGYYTQRARSVRSNEPGHSGQELPLDFMLQAKNMKVNVAPNTSHGMVRTMSDQRSVAQHSSRSGGHRQRFPCPEPGCSVTSKCASEHKRHMLKHEKNFICGERHCKRDGKGFSTVNDLERHMKSVHKIGIEKSKSYQCAAAGCTNKTKIWPRLDNFKQHLERMHKDEDAVELIRRSEYHCQEVPLIEQSFTFDPALLVGMEESKDSPASTGASAFSYQPLVPNCMISPRRASDVSPITTSLDGFLPQLSLPPSTRGIPTDDRLMLSLGDLPNTLQKRGRSTEVSTTSTATTSLQAAHCSPRNRDTMPPPPSPNGSQTESKQQRHALEKLSKANIKIEDMLFHGLAAHPNASVVLSDDERVHAAEAIADILKERSRPVRSQQHRSTQRSVRCYIEDCDFSGLPSDLRKHMKRHQKPYGCTYSKCYKRFGAKSDWKRHENSQHFQLEEFRCDHEGATGEKCGHHCYLREQFQNHLAATHEVTLAAQVETSLTRCRIGKSCQDQYWCGFCRGIQVLESKHNRAWNERFNHIAHHFEQEKLSIDDWLCVEENRTKKELRIDMDKDTFGDEGLEDVDTEAFYGDGAHPGCETAPSLTAQSFQHANLHESAAPPNTRCIERPGKQAEQQLIVLRQCCQCSEISTVIQVDCFACRHVLCNNCIRVRVGESPFPDHSRL